MNTFSNYILTNFETQKGVIGLRVGVGTLPATESGDDVDEPPVELDASLGTAGLLLLLLLGVDFRGLAANFSGTSQRTVDFATLQGQADVDGAIIQAVGHFDGLLDVQRTAVDVQADLFAALAFSNELTKLSQRLVAVQVEEIALLTAN